MPDTVKALSTSFLQIHKELEEAAWISGRGMLSTIATIVLPLARPGVVASMTLLFVLSVRELGSSLFLYTSDTTVMAVLLLDYYEGGNIGKTAAFSLVQTAILAVLLGFTTWLSRGAAQSSARDCGNQEETRVQENDAADRSAHRLRRRAGPHIASRGTKRVRLQGADRGGREGRLAHLLHGQLRRGRAGGDQGLQQALPQDQGLDGARAGRPADHPHQDRGGGRQAGGRRGRPFRPRPDEGHGRPVPGLHAAQRRRLPARRAGQSPSSGPASRSAGRSPTTPSW